MTKGGWNSKRRLAWQMELFQILCREVKEFAFFYFFLQVFFDKPNNSN